MSKLLLEEGAGVSRAIKSGPLSFAGCGFLIVFSFTSGGGVCVGVVLLGVFVMG